MKPKCQYANKKKPKTYKFMMRNLKCMKCTARTNAISWLELMVKCDTLTCQPATVDEFEMNLNLKVQCRRALSPQDVCYRLSNY